MSSFRHLCLMVCHSRFNRESRSGENKYLDSRFSPGRSTPAETGRGNDRREVPVFVWVADGNILTPSSAASGFTLIEILVALVIVAITVSVVLETQITSLKIEQKARALQLFRFETERIFSAARRVKNEEELTRLLETNNLCRIKSEKIQIESGTNVLSFIKHELSADPSAIASATAEDLPAFSSVFFTRVPDYPGRRSAAGGAPVNGPKSTVAP